MTTYTFVITGTNRGLGLVYTAELLKRGHAVVATTRKTDSKELEELKQQYGDKLEIVKLDVSDRKSAEDAATAVSELPIAKAGVDFLINNAGIFAGRFSNGIFGVKDPVADLRRMMNVNLYGTIYVTTAFLPLLRKSNKKVIVNISSAAGAIGTNFSDVAISSTYSISKCAVNMLSRKFHGELAADGFIVATFHPGLVKTDMGSPASEAYGDDPLFAGVEALEPEDAAKYGVDFFQKLTTYHSAGFFAYTGEEMAW
ncbi:hypothetical protein ACM66B_003202 [Microbotryomycetes sp. NB124-2]